MATKLAETMNKTVIIIIHKLQFAKMHMLTQGGTNASYSMKLTSTINQNELRNFTYHTEKNLILIIILLLSISFYV